MEFEPIERYFYPLLVKVVSGADVELPEHVALYLVARSITYQMVHGSVMGTAMDAYSTRFADGTQGTLSRIAPDDVGPLSKEELMFCWLMYTLYGDLAMYSDEQQNYVSEGMKKCGVEYTHKRIPAMIRPLILGAMREMDEI
ncbi:hypothetical protein [uncultured Ferrimonas sp.]|uniref:hypothetical protein n=1 Tax=uncultured Ferrimonas sp. TaxID=432640 RepID=UPI00263464A4|nr:hypothetical protein [uncultured Ferrimonas sp.]